MIRLLTPNDAAQYRQLRLLSLQTEPHAFLSLHHQESSLPLSHFQQRIAAARTFPIFGIYGFFQNNQLIAKAQLAPINLAKKSHLANIFQLYVHPDCRRQKIATNLINHFANLAKTHSIEQLHLYANSLNQAAIDFYTNLNFQLLATIPQAVKEPNNSYQDEFIFVLNLS